MIHIYWTVLLSPLLVVFLSPCFLLCVAATFLWTSALLLPLLFLLIHLTIWIWWIPRQLEAELEKDSSRLGSRMIQDDSIAKFRQPSAWSTASQSSGSRRPDWSLSALIEQKRKKGITTRKRRSDINNKEKSKNGTGKMKEHNQQKKKAWHVKGMFCVSIKVASVYVLLLLPVSLEWIQLSHELFQRFLSKWLWCASCSNIDSFGCKFLLTNNENEVILKELCFTNLVVHGFVR